MKKSKEIKSAYKNENINTVIYSVEISQIVPNTAQPRNKFDIKAITKLADSIRRYGLLQPLSIRKNSINSKNSPKYELVAGERRLRACKMLGMTQVPCIIVDASDETSAELAIIENTLRENLNMFEQAKAFSVLSTQFSLTQEEIAARMCLSQSAVANKMRLLRLSVEEQELILSAELSERHARALLRIASPQDRKEALEYIICNKLNVNETDKYISSLIKGEETTAKKEIYKTYTSGEICKNIYKFVAKMQKESKNLIINRKSDDKFVVITLTVRKDA
ncbi:MAG: ParB/RepB/Spo0J family partition protein [Clostridia bacterium]|nr:ParB/RepB/Spo0J family partition protein [Clostridia bacterium]